MSLSLDRGLVKLQLWLPVQLISRIVRRVSRCRLGPVKNLLIRVFVWLYNVNVEEAAKPVPQGYPDFNAFFTRSLQPGSRNIDASPGSVCSPADGTMTQVGEITGQQLVQAKNMTYTLSQLLGGDEIRSQALAGGSYATIYLAPHNYHRVHMPLDGELTEMAYIPGRLLSVSMRTADVIPGLFIGNERLTCSFEGDAGPFSLILVGAMNVGSISTAWAGEVLPGKAGDAERWTYPGPEGGVSLNKGDCLGTFNLGSTVIFVAGPGQLAWNREFTAGSSLRVGQKIGALPAMESG
jgi:phosphatidylserine decarboxylase